MSAAAPPTVAARRPHPIATILAVVSLPVGAMAIVALLGAVFAGAGPGRSETTPRTWDFRDGLGLEAVSGRLAAAEGTARATAASGIEPAVALGPRASATGRLQVVAARPDPGWGIALRWQDVDDHWFVAVPDDGGPLAIGRRDGAVDEVLGRASGATLAPGDHVDVRFDRRRVDVRVDGRLVAHVSAVADVGGRAGLRATADDVAWSRLEIGPRPAPVLRPGED